jgi:hypothetical protein
MTHPLLSWPRGASARGNEAKKPSGHSGRRKPWLQIEDLEERTVPAGTWSTLANAYPEYGAGLMMLLSDGTVMVQGGEEVTSSASSTWYKLTPDASGSYLLGTWAQLASMNTMRIDFGSNVLSDGRVFVMGGEYTDPNTDQNNVNTGEIYDPVANTWTKIANFTKSQFGSAPTEVLSSGDVLCGYLNGPQSYLYDPLRNTWTATGAKQRGDQSFGETWLKLPDGSILSYDIYASSDQKRFEAQRYIPSEGLWVDASNLDPDNPPGILSTTNVGKNLGPAFLMPNGNAIFFGANGNTAIYNPSTSTWTAGPAEPTVTLNGHPTQLVMAGTPGAMMPNGNILVSFVPEGTLNAKGVYTYPFQTWIYEFNPVTNTYTDVTPPNFLLSVLPGESITMLMLPTGQVMVSNTSGQIDLYTPVGSPDPAAQPTISNIANHGNNTFTLTGTQLNGISEGASFGDDNLAQGSGGAGEMATNYPIIRLTDAQGNVSNARSFKWSSTGVATGGTPEMVEFTFPPGLAPGPYLVSVVANGIASVPVLDVVTGTTDTKLALQLDATDPTSLDVLNNGSRLAQFPVGSLSSIFVFGSDAHDAITISDGPAALSGIPLTVNGGITDSLVLQGFASSETFTISPDTIGWGGSTIIYAGIGSASITGGPGDNTFKVLGTTAATALTIVGGGSGDQNTLVGFNSGNTFLVQGNNAGALFGSAYGSSVLFHGVGNLTAGSGGDTYQFADGASVTGNLTGAGSDTLDFSNDLGSVIVDLQTGFATGVGGAVSGISTVVGGASTPSGSKVYNLLIGNGGDTLVGGFDRENILVAGSRASTLIGGTKLDLLIGGSTAYDTEAGLTSWNQIASFWVTKTNVGILMADLTSGTGVPILDGSIVMSNGGGNTFAGEGEVALLFSDGMDSMNGFNNSSLLVPIDP